MKLLADANLGPFEGIGTLGNFTKALTKTGTKPFELFISTFSTGIGVLTVAAGIWFIIQIFSGAFQWLASGGEKQALQNAHKRIVNAILGLFVVIFSYALIGIIGLVFGLNILCPFGDLFSNRIGGAFFSCYIPNGSPAPNPGYCGPPGNPCP